MNKRILPYNIDVIDVERSVLGAVMLNRRALTDVLEIVKSIVDYIQLMEDKKTMPADRMKWLLFPGVLNYLREKWIAP